jgi:hypothetical protein
LKFFDSSSDIQYGNSFQQSIKTAIKECDFLVFIYTENNPYIAFEAGIAVATNKPIFSILAGGAEDSFLYDSTCVHANPNELDKIKFSFDLFIKNLPVKKTGRALLTKASPTRYYGGGEALPMKHYFDVKARYNLLDDKSGIALELFFQEIFSAYHINIVKNSDFQNANKNWIPDFSIWSDDLTSLLGNPIIVEVKREINITNLKQLLTNLDGLASSNPLNGVLIFYDSLNGIDKLELPVMFNRLFISIADLVDQLTLNGFASAVKKLRNNLIHQS